MFITKHSTVALFQSCFHFDLIFLDILAVLYVPAPQISFSESKFQKSRYPDSNTQMASSHGFMTQTAPAQHDITVITARQPCPHCMHTACSTRADWDRNDGAQRAYATQRHRLAAPAGLPSTTRTHHMSTPYGQKVFHTLNPERGRWSRPAARSAQPAG